MDLVLKIWDFSAKISTFTAVLKPASCFYCIIKDALFTLVVVHVTAFIIINKTNIIILLYIIHA